MITDNNGFNSHVKSYHYFVFLKWHFWWICLWLLWQGRQENGVASLFVAQSFPEDMRNPQWLQLIKISPGTKCPQKWWKHWRQFLTVKSVAPITLNVVSIKIGKENFVFVQVQMAWFKMNRLSVIIQIEISRT